MNNPLDSYTVIDNMTDEIITSQDIFCNIQNYLNNNNFTVIWDFTGEKI